MAQNVGLWTLSFTHLQKKLRWICKSSFKWIQQKLFKKIYKNLYIDQFWPHLGPEKGKKIWSTGAFSRTPESIPNGPVRTKFHGPVLKPFWENGPKTSQFLPIFVIKDPSKNQNKKI